MKWTSLLAQGWTKIPGAQHSKGKSHKPYEFGCKVSVITTANRSKGGQFALAATALHGNNYDGHTLKSAIDEYEQTTGVKTQRIYVDKGIEVMIRC
jgi:IS5 family transposase